MTKGAGITVLSATMVGVAAVVSKKISKFVVDTALDREGPKPMKGAKNPNNSVVPDELATELCTLSEKLKNSGCETVEIISRDGEIHGTDDTFVPVEMTYENYKACNAPKKLFVVPGATHAMSYLVDKDGYENVVKEFWENYDASV